MGIAVFKILLIIRVILQYRYIAQLGCTHINFAVQELYPWIYAYSMYFFNM